MVAVDCSIYQITGKHQSKSPLLLHLEGFLGLLCFHRQVQEEQLTVAAENELN
jgi:hypothetical protein